jgi:uncharacterized protein YlbG (UPF0298 family)
MSVTKYKKMGNLPDGIFATLQEYLIISNGDFDFKPNEYFKHYSKTSLMQQIKFDLIYISERELEIESDYLETVEYLKNITDDEFDTLKAEFLEAYLKN